MSPEQQVDLFESGWADFRANLLDKELFKTQNFYRGGWMAASSVNIAEAL